MPTYYPSALTTSKLADGKIYRTKPDEDPFFNNCKGLKRFFSVLETQGISNLHGCRLALAGTLCKLGVEDELAFSIIFWGLSGAEDSQKVVESTYARDMNGLPITGGVALRGIIGRPAFSRFLELVCSEFGVSEINLRRALLVEDGFPLEDTRELFRKVIPILRDMGFPDKALSRLSGLAACKVYGTDYKQSSEKVWGCKHRCGRKVCGQCRQVYWREAKVLMKQRLAKHPKIRIARMPIDDVEDLDSIKAKVWRVASSKLVIYTDFMEEELIFVGDIDPVVETFGLEIETLTRDNFIAGPFHHMVFSLSDRVRHWLKGEDFIDAIFDDQWLRSGQMHTYSRKKKSSSPFIPPKEELVREIIKERAIQARIEAGVVTILDIDPEAKPELDENGRPTFEFEHRNLVTGLVICSTEKPIPPWEIRLEEVELLARGPRHVPIMTRSQLPKLE